MQYGFVLPGGDIHTLAQLAYEAEEAGWDGVFIPDCIYIEGTQDNSTSLGFDPWIALAAIAMCTERIRIGPMLTPPSRRRPWKLARETTTLDILSQGRLILSVGLGALDDGGFGKVGDATDVKTRAQMLDESLAILAGLWSGKPFSFDGTHYSMQEMTFTPTPIQKPRIPVWVVGAWPHQKSMQRVLQWDGLLPNKKDSTDTPITPADIQAMKAYIDERRTHNTPFDIVMEGTTLGDKPEATVAIVRPFVEAGITWWLESMWFAPNGPNELRARIQQGPPSKMLL